MDSMKFSHQISHQLDNKNFTMAAILQRIFFLYNILYSFILNFIPKKLKLNLIGTKTPPSPAASPPPPRFSTPVRQVFEMFDRNKDGRITKNELNESLENLGIFIPSKELSEMIEKMDKNGDGCVDMEEFKGLYESIMEERNDDDEEDGDLKEAFEVFDKNGDGFISVDELRMVLISLGEKQGRNFEDCKKMIIKVDVDGDGMVNYKEFKQMMKGNVLC